MSFDHGTHDASFDLPDVKPGVTLLEADDDLNMHDILLNTLGMAAELEADMIKQHIVEGHRAAKRKGSGPRAHPMDSRPTRTDTTSRTRTSRTL